MGMDYVYSAPIVCWQPADDIAMQLFKIGSSLEIFYVNSSYDIDTLLDVLKPEYSLSGL